MRGREGAISWGIGRATHVPATNRALPEGFQATGWWGTYPSTLGPYAISFRREPR